MVDVEGEPHRDAALLSVEQGGRDELCGLLLEVEVVEREVEALLRSAQEAGDELGDLERALTPVRQGADVDVRRSRGP
jgi:hypothetical protein